jgi:glycosyltransferase involved in cell wall biosynthesis
MAPHVFIVIPMLNEEDTIADTCSSLGVFRSAPERHFLLVDNGSTDRTLAIADGIRAKAAHPVEIVRERERGHVPARRTGCRVARERAQMRLWPLEDVIVCQADADTIYDDSYLAQMTTAMAAGTGSMYEGRSVLRGGNDTAAVVQRYLAACLQTDEQVENCFAAEADDVVVDDKVVAYYLSDYFRWGEHQREYCSRGDELLAETTRLYMRARARGASRIYVNNAVAQHSTRRIVAEEWMHFASAGFPRETSWRRRHENHVAPADLTNDTYAGSIRLRHLIGLFALLPAHVAVALGALKHDRFSALVPSRTLAELHSAPGVLLQDVLEAIDQRGDELIRACQTIP